MFDVKTMNEIFPLLLHQSKQTILEKLGTPKASYNRFDIYHKDGMWMVLFFRDIIKNNSLITELQSITIYDDSLCLLWSKGVQLIENAAAMATIRQTSVTEFISKYGTPHAQLGGMISALQYLTSNGEILVVKYHHDKIIGFKLIKLPDLPSHK